MIPRSAETHSVRLSQPECCVSLASTLNEGPSNEHSGQNEHRLRPEDLAGDSQLARQTSNLRRRAKVGPVRLHASLLSA